jgi:hypothetical protein
LHELVGSKNWHSFSVRSTTQMV